MRSNLITFSRSATMNRCKRQAYYAYEMGLRPKRIAKPLRMGSAFHEGLDLKAKGATSEEAIIGATADYNHLPAWCVMPEDIHAWEVERETVAVLLSCYFWWWSEVRDEVDKIIHSEVRYRLPIINPLTGRSAHHYEHGGKRDKIVVLKNGRVALMEHKTTSEDLDSADYWAKLRIDSQLNEYYSAALQEGIELDTILYDVTKKPTIRPRLIPRLDDQGRKIVVDEDGKRVMKKCGKEPRQSADQKKGWRLLSTKETARQFGERLTADIAARPEYYFRRVELDRLTSDIEEHRYELWQQKDVLSDCQRHDRWGRNTDACITPGRKCPYLSICHLNLKIGAEDIPEGFEIVDDVHPELSNIGEDDDE